ncbi:universal stress protein [Rubrobacter indicoceani]|uniref:universal stress protein n=1 Tax=Rubrobacter indicoceani TaxID=2051957 RepID=UPI000E5AF9E5|nr:universal stress protein [Rubrobacter indicoceani]
MAFFPRRVLLAADRSDESLLAIEAATDLCRETGSELHIVYVGLLSPFTQPNAISEVQYQRLRAEAQEILEEQVATARSLGGKVTRAHLRMGRADSEIIRLGDELEAGMIVIGSRGQHTLSRVLLGNDAESIVRHAPCPVLVIRQDA